MIIDEKEKHIILGLYQKIENMNIQWINEYGDSTEPIFNSDELVLKKKLEHIPLH
jgi:hypothetical protein